MIFRCCNLFLVLQASSDSVVYCVLPLVTAPRVRAPSVRCVVHAPLLCFVYGKSILRYKMCQCCQGTWMHLRTYTSGCKIVTSWASAANSHFDLSLVDGLCTVHQSSITADFAYHRLHVGTSARWALKLLAECCVVAQAIECSKTHERQLTCCIAPGICQRADHIACSEHGEAHYDQHYAQLLGRLWNGHAVGRV